MDRYEIKAAARDAVGKARDWVAASAAHKIIAASVVAGIVGWWLGRLHLPF